MKVVIIEDERPAAEKLLKAIHKKHEKEIQYFKHH